MLLSDVYEIDTWLSLGGIAAILGASIWASLRHDPTLAAGSAPQPSSQDEPPTAEHSRSTKPS
jgi:hypothetical protein